MKDSSEPVETSSTRTPSTGRSCSARASSSTTATPDRLSLAPGTTGRSAMSANAAVEPSERNVPSRRSGRRPLSAPSATRAGPATTSSITCGEVSCFSYQPGNASAGTVVSCRGEHEPAVRGVVVGDEHDRALRAAVARLRDDVVGRPPRQQAAEDVRPARDVVGDPGGGRRARRGGQGPRRAPAASGGQARQPGGRGHQPERDPIGAVRRLLLDPSVSTRTIQALADPLRGPALAVGRRRALDRRQVLDGGAEALGGVRHRRGRLPCAAWPPIPTASSARSSPGRSPPRGSRRTSARSPSWTSTPPRAGTSW